MKQGFKHFLFVLILLLMILPFVQQQFNFPKVRGLKGAFNQPVKPKLSVANLLNASYQDSLNNYLEHHIGYRPDLVRLFNQFRYSVFDTIVAQGVIFGKEGYLYELNYIKALYGLDFVGAEKVQHDVEQTVFVNNWLKKHNKHLMVVFAPGKASYFPEYVPEKYKPETIGPKNLDEYYRLLTQHSIPAIDGNKLFLSSKDTSRYALYPKCGIHWSYYGMGLVFDSIIQSMKQLTQKNFIDFGVKNLTVTNQLRSPDRDLWEGMNIFIQPDDFAMPYPEFYFENAKQEISPRVIVVADSYYWQWFGGGYAGRTFKKHEFWYYNTQIYTGDGNPPAEKKDVDIMLRVMDCDVIVLLQTDANMSRFSFGFINDLYEAIQKTQSIDIQAMTEIQIIIERIRSSESYMQMIKEKAQSRHISVDEMLRIDATWVYEHNQKQKVQ